MRSTHTAIATATASLMLLCTTFLQGCSTVYVAALRDEHITSDKVVEGIYGKGDKYPSLYHATWVCACHEVPQWFKQSKYDIDKTYKRSSWLVGVPLSLADLALSLVTDTVMLPFDCYCFTCTYSITRKGNVENKKRKGEAEWEVSRRTMLGQPYWMP